MERIDCTHSGVLSINMKTKLVSTLHKRFQKGARDSLQNLSLIFIAEYNTKILKERQALVLNQFEHISVLSCRCCLKRKVSCGGHSAAHPHIQRGVSAGGFTVHLRVSSSYGLSFVLAAESVLT